MRILDAHPCFMNQKARFRPLLIALAIFLLYAGLAILITWPLAANIDQVLPGGSGDTLLHYWNGWVTGQSLSQNQSPFYSNAIFHPQGVSLMTHNMAWFQIGPWLILEQFLNGITAYNIVLLLNLTLCGMMTFLLAKKISRNIKSAFLAGLIYMAWPFRLSQLDHPNLLATQWIPLFLLFLILLLEKGRWRDVVFMAVSFALIGYGRWQLLIPAGVMALILIIWNWPRWWPRNERSRLLKLLISGLLTAILLLPPAWLLLQEQQNDPGAADLFRGGEESIMQADLLAYITPSNEHFLLREITTPIYDHYYEGRFPSRRYSPYIGITTLLLIIIAVLKKRKEAMPWLLMGLGLILLGLGPLLRINGQEFPEFPMLYKLLEPLQLFRLMRVPDRFNMFAALPAAILGGLGSLVILSKFKGKWMVRLVYAALLIFVLLEYLVIPVKLYDIPQPSPFYDDLAQEQGSFAILNLPFDSLKAKEYMFSQVTHQRPLVQGNLSRIPPGAYGTIESNLWMNSLRNTVEMDPIYRDVSQQLSHLADQDIRYLIMHKNLVGADRIEHWQRYLLSQPYYEDQQIIVYRTRPIFGQDVTYEDVLIPGLGIVKIMTSSACVQAGQTLEVDVGWGSMDPIDQDISAEFTLFDSENSQNYQQSFAISEGYPSSAWPAESLHWGYYKIQIPKTMPPGVHDLRLSLIDVETGGKIASSQLIGPLEIHQGPCIVDPIEGTQAINASFGDQLHLLAYEVEQNSHLDLRLYWQANQRMDNDYKIFIHVYDLETAVPVAQDDAMPHRNAYPTRFWGLQEIVDDRIQISLNDVPPGTYGLAVGVYDPISGERLEVVDSQGNIAADGRLIVPEQVIVP